MDPDFCVLRVTLLPGGILHITSVRQAEVGTYRCVANTRHGQGAQLTLSSKQGLGDSEWAPGREEGMGAGTTGSRYGRCGGRWYRYFVETDIWSTYGL